MRVVPQNLHVEEDIIILGDSITDLSGFHFDLFYPHDTQGRTFNEPKQVAIEIGINKGLAKFAKDVSVA